LKKNDVLSMTTPQASKQHDNTMDNTA